MRLFAVSLKGNMLKLGTTPEATKWYFMTDEIIQNQVLKDKDGKPYLKDYKNGDEVTIVQETKQGSLYVTSLTKVGSSSVAMPVTKTAPVAPVTVAKPTVAPATPVQSNWNKPAQAWDGNKSPAVQEAIKRQATAHAATRALIALQGKITDVQQLAQAFDYMYDAIETKLNQ